MPFWVTETCTGDLRAGRVMSCYSMPEQAIETLNEANVKKIVVSCARFNTIANEYPELGGLSRSFTNSSC